MAEIDAITQKLSATPDEFRATAQRTGLALLKRISESSADQSLQKGVRDGFEYYAVSLFTKDLRDLMTELEKHVCSKILEPKRAYITYVHSRC